MFEMTADRWLCKLRLSVLFAIGSSGLIIDLVAQTMRRHSLLLSLFLLTAFASCSDERSSQEFKESQRYFLNSMKSFGKANESAARIFEDFLLGKLNSNGGVISHISKGIAESENVTGNYLVFIHPQLEAMYRGNLVGSYKLFVDNIGIQDAVKAKEIDMQISKKQNEFWTFMRVNQDAINLKMKQVESKTFGQSLKAFITADGSKKSYWRMFIRFIISDFVSIFVFSFYLIALMLPLAPLGLFAPKMNKVMLQIISIPFVVVAGAGQVYFWILWAAYCSFTIQFYMDSPAVYHNWLYYITGFLFVTGPIFWLSQKAKQIANSYDEHRNIEKGTFYYSLIAIIAFIVFCIWTNLLEYGFISWANDWLYQ